MDFQVFQQRLLLVDWRLRPLRQKPLLLQVRLPSSQLLNQRFFQYGQRALRHSPFCRYDHLPKLEYVQDCDYGEYLCFEILHQRYLYTKSFHHVFAERALNQHTHQTRHVKTPILAGYDGSVNQICIG